MNRPSRSTVCSRGTSSEEFYEKLGWYVCMHGSSQGGRTKSDSRSLGLKEAPMNERTQGTCFAGHGGVESSPSIQQAVASLYPRALRGFETSTMVHGCIHDAV